MCSTVNPINKGHHRLESRMRENRPSGSEGGGANRLSLPLCDEGPSGANGIKFLHPLIFLVLLIILIILILPICP